MKKLTLRYFAFLFKLNSFSINDYRIDENQTRQEKSVSSCSVLFLIKYRRIERDNDEGRKQYILRVVLLYNSTITLRSLL
jgi:hypothetical protein